jgi:hypothetical protein
MSSRSLFIALVIGFGLVLAGFLINRRRPVSDTSQGSAAMMRVTGKCAECHTEKGYAIVHQYESSAHAAKGINCLEPVGPHWTHRLTADRTWRTRCPLS